MQTRQPRMPKVNVAELAKKGERPRYRLLLCTNRIVGFRCMLLNPVGHNYLIRNGRVTICRGRCSRGESMASLQEFRCEVCGTVSSNPIHWFVIQCGDSELTVLKWNANTSNAVGARHFCGEGHAQVYISRWFDSVCSPSIPDFTRSVAPR